jgi:hypothetical protein
VAPKVLGVYGPTPFPWTDSDYIWHGTSHNEPKTTARMSGSCLYFPMSYGWHKLTDTPTPSFIV